jgi:tetratricopeptide (TPR) repeat protein
LARSSTLTEVPIGWLPPTNALVNMSRREFNAVDENRFENLSHRAAAWALVHYLEIGAPDLAPRFDRYLAALRAGARSPEEAWASEFGDVDVNGRVRHYLTEATQYVELAWEAPARATPTARPMTRAEGELHWAWLWSFHSAEDRAHAREHALRAMGDPRARAEAALIVALADVAQGKTAAARAAVDRGLSEMPRDAALLALAVELRHSLWREQGVMSPDVDQLAARLLPVARLPEQHVVLSAHALIRNDEERALAHSQRAITIGPGSWRCWVARALATGAAERWPEALAALDRAMNLLPHGDRSGATQLARVRKGILVRARERGVSLD